MSQTKLFVLLIALYLAQGLPAGFIAHALPTLLREQGASLVLIGFLKLLALPWLLKFLWAPLIDRSIASNGHHYRKRWIYAMQGATAILLIGLSFTIGSPGIAFLSASVAMILLINTCAATQDVVTDGIAVSSASSGDLGWVNSVQVGGYKVGMIAGGSGLLLLSALFNWQLLFFFMAMLLLVLLLPLFFLAQGPAFSAEQARHEGHVETSHHWWQSLKGFFSQDGILPFVFVLLTYKLSDGLGSSMLKPMLIDFGWSKPEIGSLILQASLVGLLGAFLAGLFYRWLGKYRGLIIFAVLQIFSVSAFYLISIDSLTSEQIRLLVCTEQFCDGLSTVALFAAMMSHCRPEHEGSDYTVQASLQIVLAGVLGAFSGLLSQFLGYSVLYILCAVFGIFTLASIVIYRKNNINLQEKLS